MAVPVIADWVKSGAGSVANVQTVPLSTYSTGDVLVVIISLQSTSAAATDPTGWERLIHTSGASPLMAWARKTDGTEGSSVSISFSADTFYVQRSCMTITGAADPATVTYAAGASWQGSTTTPTAPSRDALSDDALVLRPLSITSSNYATVPTGTTLVLSNNTGGVSRALMVASQDAAQPAGATGTAAWSNGNTSYQYYAGTIVIESGDTGPSVDSATISGTSQIGSTLTANAGTTPDPVDSIAYRWQQASDGSGTGAADISGETSNTLALTYADFGAMLDAGDAYVRFGAIATEGADSSDEVFSDWQQVTVPSSGSSGGSLFKSSLIN